MKPHKPALRNDQQPSGGPERGVTSIPSRRLGATGIITPPLGIGCWAIGGPDENLGMSTGWSTGADPDRSLAGLEAAWSGGARLYDTADIYGHGRSERILGRLVTQVPRAEIVLSSKVGYFSGTAAHGYEPGHMRRQLEQTLDNLRTDHLDIYAFHHPDFGPGDTWLHPAIAAMRAFRDEGLMHAIGMRGPHRFALDPPGAPPARTDAKLARFRHLFEAIQPDTLAVRDNLLTPHRQTDGVFAFADQYDVGILISKPLAQGLLTGTYSSTHQRDFGPGDHRNRKSLFSPEAANVINTGLDELRDLVGPEPADLIRVALWACLIRSPNTVALVGFTSPDQVRLNLQAIGDPPGSDALKTARVIMAAVQTQLRGLGLHDD